MLQAGRDKDDEERRRCGRRTGPNGTLIQGLSRLVIENALALPRQIRPWEASACDESALDQQPNGHR
ncbi:hypothetical protein GCM10023178_44670 [Actinomadura luteofluorescens]